MSDLVFAVFPSMGAHEEATETCGTICLKYLLFAFNFMFWVSLPSAVVEGDAAPADVFKAPKARHQRLPRRAAGGRGVGLS